MRAISRPDGRDAEFLLDSVFISGFHFRRGARPGPDISGFTGSLLLDPCGPMRQGLGRLAARCACDSLRADLPLPPGGSWHLTRGCTSRAIRARIPSGAERSHSVTPGVWRAAPLVSRSACAVSRRTQQCDSRTILAALAVRLTADVSTAKDRGIHTASQEEEEQLSIPPPFYEWRFPL
ncbi:hypothetical protein AAFF_G00055370 [Aldrovandia affinis]|uniref:Uncharacterized protein n=1 Tax=Aldrovandia affinis TaxID=143900 RepID=A0AAD7VXV1_9TELE|nr:hypothetical protein AAFF_G00055370 [Aldrovandia affinis]